MDDERRYWAGGLIGMLIVSAINYLAHTPVRFLLSMAGLVALLYATRRLTQQFDVPLIFLRSNGINYWSAAFGGLLGGIGGLYGAQIGNTPLTVFLANLSLAFIYLCLALTLFAGTLLQDIEDGYIEV